MFWISESTSFSDTGNSLPHDIHPLPDVPSQPSPLPIDQCNALLEDESEEIGYAEEWLHNHTILAMHFTSLNRATIDRWLRTYGEFHRQASPGALAFLMFQMGAQITTLPAYARTVAHEVNLRRPELKAYVAVVLPRSVMGQMFKLFLWSLSTTWRLSTVRAFFDATDALEWLKRQVDYNSPLISHA